MLMLLPGGFVSVINMSTRSPQRYAVHLLAVTALIIPCATAAHIVGKRAKIRRPHDGC